MELENQPGPGQQGDRAPSELQERILQRLSADDVCTWHDCTTGARVKRSPIAYNQQASLNQASLRSADRPSKPGGCADALPLDATFDVSAELEVHALVSLRSGRGSSVQ